jgi:hypothetical protein
VEEEVPTTAELLEQWREATRAAELAERLADLATQAAEQADRSAVASEQIAKMAEKAANAAERAATTARKAAKQAEQLAEDNRGRRLPDAQSALEDARATEAGARDRYRAAERRRQDGD